MDPFFKVLFLRAVNSLILFIEVFTDVLLGWTFTRGTREERELARSYYECSAQLVNVLAKANFVPGCPLPRNGVYIYSHKKYIDPKTVLENDNVVLSHFTETEAIFGVGDVDKDIQDTKAFPFLPIGIYYGCKQHIRVSMSTFHRMADEHGVPRVKVGITLMTARSGSTLLNQIMNRVPGTRSLSEPHAVSNLWYLFSDGTIDFEEVRKRARGAVIVLAKTQTNSKVERVFMKLCPFGTPLCGILHEMFPDICFVLSTRHPLPSVISFRKVWAIFSQGLFGLTGQSWRAHGRTMGYPLVKNKYSKVRQLVKSWRQPIDFDEFSAMVYAGSLSSAKEQRHIFKQVIMYEELTKNPSVVVGRLFENMGIREDVSVGLEAMEIDSQNGLYSIQNISKDVLEKTKESARKIYEEFDLALDHDCTVLEFKRYLSEVFLCAQEN